MTFFRGTMEINCDFNDSNHFKVIIAFNGKYLEKKSAHEGTDIQFCFCLQNIKQYIRKIIYKIKLKSSSLFTDTISRNNIDNIGQISIPIIDIGTIVTSSGTRFSCDKVFVFSSIFLNLQEYSPVSTT